MRTQIRLQIPAIMLAILSMFLVTSCGDSDSFYVTSINNKSSCEVLVRIIDDTTIVCLSNMETIIEESWGSSSKKMTCRSPYYFKNGMAEIIIDEGSKVLTKDIADDVNWNCEGEKDWNLIMLGSYYSKITYSFTINDEDLKEME